ncbi:sensor histidine kinase [Ramlibacter rhizophilus]|nr:HAMP domain-containing sensor histidine kinase [Ramlibacter rhizophilus]
MRVRSGRDALKPLLEPMLEPILHPSQWRIRALCISIVIGHPLFYVIWTHFLPQPYESLWQRLAVSALGLSLLVSPRLTAVPPSRFAVTVITLVFWATLPLYFTWMYFCNGRNAVWFATLAAMFLIYYHVTDWRVATIGIAAGLGGGWLLFALFGPTVQPLTLEESLTHAVVFSFCWYMGLMLGLSSSNLRREQIKQALGTMGIMAHELRTPLATMALIGDAVRSTAATAPTEATGLEQLATRLHALVRNMNRQIDMQITNAQLMHLPPQTELVSAASLIRKAVAAFPYRNERERECAQVRVERDFEFNTSEALFTQVIDNLVKNALRALAATPAARSPGDLVLSVDLEGGTGVIRVTDRGVGISERAMSRLFQPFVSSNQGTGHGLGLAFCQRVILAAGGTIKVHSVPGEGAEFVIRLPARNRFPIKHPTLKRSIS